MRLMPKKILVVQETSAKVTEGGITLPDQSVTTLPKGTVKLIGKDVPLYLLDSRVLFSSIGGTLVEVSGKPYVLLEEEDILIILEEGDN